MRHYCTLFDSRYLPQGLALYESLRRHSSADFTLFVLAMDDMCRRRLEALDLPDLEIVMLESVERAMGLERVRPQRTWREYCWTCGSNLAAYLIHQVSEITYLDADTMMFSDPEVVFAEIGERSIAITPHRLVPAKKHLEVNGRFNVGWTSFKATAAGRDCLWTWAAQCRERCSETIDCGDQKYLDAWPETYGSDCCIIANIGVNAAPWNLCNWTVTEGPKVDGVPIVHYHFHEFAALDAGGYRLTNYVLPLGAVQFIYQPYIAAITAAKERVGEQWPDGTRGCPDGKPGREGTHGYQTAVKRPS